MNAPHTRREFLADVGRGMLVATVGYGLASELGLAPAFAAGAADAADTLDFGPLEPLVRFMQETPAVKLIPAPTNSKPAPTSAASSPPRP